MEFAVCLVARNPLLARTLARVVSCAGARPEVVPDPNGLPAALDRGAGLVCFGMDDLPAALPLLEKRPAVGVLVWGSQRADALLELFHARPGLNHFLGLRYPDAPPRCWELLATVRRWVKGSAPPPEALLSWGGVSHQIAPATDRDRDAIVQQVERLAAQAVGERAAGTAAETAHELLMNAMYDAPVDEEGRAVMAHRRSEPIELPAARRPQFFYGCDGARLVLSVADPFGRLERSHLFGGLQRGLTVRTIDRKGGGAGLGFVVMYEAGSMLLVDVAPGRKTQVTVVFELDVPPREQRLFPRSVHFFVGEFDNGTCSRN